MAQYTVKMATYHTETVIAKNKADALQIAISRTPSLKMEVDNREYTLRDFGNSLDEKWYTGEITKKEVTISGNWRPIESYKHPDGVFNAKRHSGECQDVTLKGMEKV